MSEKEYPTEENVRDEGNQNPPEEKAAESEAHEPVDDKHSEKAEEPKKENSRFKTTPGVLIFLFCVFIAFVFCIAGMPIGMFNSRQDSSCISIWGYKPKCLGTWFRHMDFEDFRESGLPCKKADSLIQGAQAFSVMCIIGGFLSVVVAFLEVFNYAELAVVAGIMSCINTVATLVVWSTMTAMFWANLCGTGVYADTYKMGAGLILFITAWCLQMVGNVALIIDIYLGNAK